MSSREGDCWALAVMWYFSVITNLVVVEVPGTLGVAVVASGVACLLSMLWGLCPR